MRCWNRFQYELTKSTENITTSEHTLALNLDKQDNTNHLNLTNIYGAIKWTRKNSNKYFSLGGFAVHPESNHEKGAPQRRDEEGVLG